MVNYRKNLRKKKGWRDGMGTWTGTDQEAEKIIHKIYEDEYEKLVRCAAAYLKARNDGLHVYGRAEDTVQELFVLVWERREDVLSSEKPVGWLYKALAYKAKAMLREDNKWTKRLLRYERFYVKPAEPDIDLELDLKGLVPKEDFDLLYSFYVMGYSYRELCAKTGISGSALGTRMHRIKRRMRKKLIQQKNFF